MPGFNDESAESISNAFGGPKKPRKPRTPRNPNPFNILDLFKRDRDFSGVETMVENSTLDSGADTNLPGAPSTSNRQPKTQPPGSIIPPDVPETTRIRVPIPSPAGNAADVMTQGAGDIARAGADSGSNVGGQNAGANTAVTPSAPVRSLGITFGDGQGLEVQMISHGKGALYNKAEGRPYEDREYVGDTFATPNMVEGTHYTKEGNDKFYEEAFNGEEGNGLAQMDLDFFLQDNGITVSNSRGGWEGAISEYQEKTGTPVTGKMDTATKNTIRDALATAETIRNRMHDRGYMR